MNWNDWTLDELICFEEVIKEQSNWYLNTYKDKRISDEKLKKDLYDVYESKINHIKTIGSEIEKFKKIPEINFSKDIVNYEIFKYLIYNE